MFPDEFMTQPATITRVAYDGDRDEYGNLTESTTEIDALCWLTSAGAGVRQRSEDTDRTNQQSAGFVAYFPAGTPLSGVDRVTVDGRTFEVIGPPARPFNPLTGSVAYVEATLAEVI